MVSYVLRLGFSNVVLVQVKSFLIYGRRLEIVGALEDKNNYRFYHQQRLNETSSFYEYATVCTSQDNRKMKCERKSQV